MGELVQTAGQGLGNWIVVLPLILALMGAALALMLRRNGRVTFLLGLLIVGSVIACDIALFWRVWQAGPVSMTMGNWLPPFGITLAADVLGAGFALSAAVVTLLVLVYAEADRLVGDSRDGFHALVLLLLAGVTGAFLTGDLFNLYVWFEVMLIASFGLIVSHGTPTQLDAAVKYGFLNVLATTLFLLALGLLYGLLGTLNMADIIGKAAAANPAALTAIAALLTLAFGMKAAAFPVNAWLPASYHAPPTGVSALFAGVLTKVGLYALLRCLVMLLPESRDVLEPVIAVVAMGSMLLGPLGAIGETNLRRAVGFLLIGGIGVAVAGIALGSAGGVSGTAAYLVHSMLTLSALYLVAGLIERTTGETDTRRMGGLYAANGALAVLFFVLVLAVAGVPPLLGFWPKLLLIDAGLARGGWLGGALVVTLVLNAVLSLIGGTRIWAQIFWRHRETPMPKAATAHRSRDWMRYGAAALLTGMVVVLGLWPEPLLVAVRSGAADLLDPSRYVASVGLAGSTP